LQRSTGTGSGKLQTPGKKIFQVFVLLQAVSSLTKFEDALENSHWRKALQVQTMWPAIFAIVKTEKSSKSTFERETLQMYAMPKIFL